MNGLLVKLVVSKVVLARLKLEVVGRGEGEPVTGFATDRAIAGYRA